MATYITSRVIQDGEIAANDLTSSTAQSLIPPGAVMSFAMSAAPVGWLPCDGAAINRTTYAPLFSAVRTTFGVGDGANTFNVPDLRGEFIRGWDNGRAIDTGRAFGSSQAHEIISHRHLALTTYQDDYAFISNNQTPPGFARDGATATNWFTDYQGGTETRPRNIALLYCIKF